MLQLSKYAVLHLLQLLLVLSTATQAQLPQASYELMTNISGTTKTYIARDNVIMQPGFVYSATGSTSFTAKIDAGLLFPPTENTYALPNGEITSDPTQGSLVGSIPGEFSVSPTGAATYTIPLDCPPGINGLQPNVSLVYNSQAGNGIAGWGWNLSGVSSITRTGRTLYHDDEITVAQLTGADNLMLDGQRLIFVNGTNLTENAMYRTEAEVYSDIRLKYINGYLCFEVKTKTGLIMEYGSSVDSYIEAQNSSTPMTWLLRKITDSNGNFMVYNYGEDNSNGEFWLDNIHYTGNAAAGVNPVNEILFEYASRPDIESSYVAGKKLSRTKLLNSILIKTGDYLHKEYIVDYHINQGYSKINSIKVNTSDGLTLFPIEFDWNNQEVYSHFEGESNVQHSEYLYSPPIFADFNGDGKRDFVNVSDNGLVKLFINNENDFEKTYEFTVYGSSGGAFKEIFPIDLNGDGYMDLVAITLALNGQYRYNYYFYDGATFTNGGGIGYKGFNTAVVDKNYIVGDFNGDGKHEILIKSTKILYNENGTGTQTTGISSWGDELLPTFPNNLNLLDFTGNGKTNLCIRTGVNGYIYELNGSTFSLILSTNELDNYSDIYPGDYNGDGYTDLFVIKVNQNSPDGYEYFWLLSKSVSFERKNLNSLYLSSNTLKGFVGDFNLDGKTDFALAEGYNKLGNNLFSFRIGINNGSGFSFETYETNYLLSDWKFLDVADYDGNGRSEINYYNFLNSWKIKSFNDSFFSTLKIIKNVLGINHNISYQPITDGITYFSTANNLVSFPVVKNLFPLYVVSSVADDVNTISYSYNDIRIHKQGKGFLGFRETQVINENKGIVQTIVNTYDSLNYFVHPIQLKTELLTNNELVKSTVYSYSKINYLNKRIFTYLSAQTTTDYLTGLSETKTISGLDSYGNPGLILTTKGSLTQRDSITYIQKGSWCPNKPQYYSTTTTYDGQSETIERTYEYNDNGNLVRELLHPNSSEFKVTTEYKDFTPFGQAQTVEVKAKDANGTEQLRSTSMAYTSSGTSKGRFVTSRTNVQGETTLYNWDETRGLLNSETTNYAYDGFGRLKETRYADGNRKTQVLQWAGGGGPTGAVYYSYAQTSGSAPVTTWFDPLGRVIQKDTYGLYNQNDIKISESTEYYTSGANKGRLYRVSEPYFEGDTKIWAKTYSAYDAYGRTTIVQTPMGNITTDYDGLSTTVTTPEGSKTITLNNSGLVASSTVNQKMVSYTYYPSGLTKTATPQGGQALSMEYNLQGKRTRLTDPDAGVIETNYNGFGELVEEKQKVHSSNFIVTTHHFEPTTGRLNSISRNGEITSYSYDTQNRVSSIEITGQHKQIFSYDDFDRVTTLREVTGNRAFERKTTYDAMGRIKRETYPSGYYTVNQYDNDYGFLREVKDKYGRQLWNVNSENARGQITEVQRGGKTTKFGFDSKGLPTGIKASGIVNLNYDFGNNGNLNYRVDSIMGQKEELVYDGMNRLTNWDIYQNNVLVKQNSMVYNPNTGTITTKSDLDNLTMLYGDNGKPHALTGISGVPTNFPTDSLRVTYTDFKKIKTLTEGNNYYILTYGIDDQRRKSEYKINGITQKTKYYFGDYEEESDNVGNTKKIHYLSGGAILITTNGVETLYYGYSDYQGNLIALASDSGTVVERYAYDPWGRRRNPADWTQDDTRTSWIIDRGYTMHEHLDQFGIINMNGRVYDPLTAMFFSPDPFVQAPGSWLNYNRYAYAYGNPFKYTDPDGEIILTAILIGAAISGTVGYFSGKAAGLSGSDLVFYTIANAIIGGISGGAGAAVGAGVASSISIGGFAGGFIAGAAGGATGGFISGIYSTGLYNTMFGTNNNVLLGGLKGAAIGGLAGGLISGTIAGIDAVKSDASFWNGRISEAGGYDGPGRFLNEEIPAGARPTETGEISTLSSNEDYGKYGMTRSYANGDPKPHFGVDYGGEVGDKVNAMYDGKVTRVGLGKSYGPNAVRTQSVINDKIYNVDYGHLSKSAVVVGDKVSSGTSIIGYMGRAGIPSYAPTHVHIAVWRPLPNGLMGFVMPHF